MRAGFPDAFQKGEKARQKIPGPWRTAGNRQVDRNDGARGSDAGIALRKEASRSRAISYGHYPFRVGDGVIGAFERFAHVSGHGTGHEQHVRMAGGGDEPKAETLQVVKGILEGVEFELAAVAGARIDEPEREASPEPLPRSFLDPEAEVLNEGVVDGRRRLGKP